MAYFIPGSYLIVFYAGIHAIRYELGYPIKNIGFSLLNRADRFSKFQRKMGECERLQFVISVLRQSCSMLQSFVRFSTAAFLC